MIFLNKNIITMDWIKNIIILLIIILSNLNLNRNNYNSIEVYIMSGNQLK